jgi:hypothetical protein
MRIPSAMIPRPLLLLTMFLLSRLPIRRRYYAVYLILFFAKTVPTRHKPH